MGINVGIPRGLFYYRYFPLWRTFLEEMGAEITVSDPTNKKILDDGVKACVDEACLPIKLFHGHVLNLANKVDFIFIPRFTSISKLEYVCPEFGGLPDMVRHTLKGLPPVIDTEVNMRKSYKNSWKAALETAGYITRDRAAARKAYTRAVEAYRQFRADERENGTYRGWTSARYPGCSYCGQDCDNCSTAAQGNCRSGTTDTRSNTASAGPDSARIGRNAGIPADKGFKALKIAVIGHVYNIYDSYINMDLMKKLNKFGIETVTIEMVQESDINRNVSELNKPMFWNYGRKAIGSALHLIREKQLDGIIYVMSFGCGIDSFVSDLIERKVRRGTDIPFIILTLDEHSGEAGLNTRLEAFIDMIGWRRAHENNISASR